MSDKVYTAITWCITAAALLAMCLIIGAAIYRGTADTKRCIQGHDVAGVTVCDVLEVRYCYERGCGWNCSEWMAYEGQADVYDGWVVGPRGRVR